MPKPLYKSMRQSFSRDVYMAVSGLVAAPAVILEVDTEEDLRLLSSNTPPQDLLIHVSSDLYVVGKDKRRLAPLYDVLDRARRSIPILAIDSDETADTLARFLDENRLLDALLLATYENRDLLRRSYQKMPALRCILDCRTATVSHRELLKEATLASASAVILRHGDVTREAADYLNTRYLKVISTDGGGIDTVAARGANGIITKDLAGAYRFLSLFPEGSILEKRRLVAHKGFTNRGQYPENTTSATVAAGKAHFDASEIDVKLTQDGVPIVTHNPTTKDMFLGDPIIPEESDYATVAALRRTEFPSEGIDRFEDLMAAMKDYPDTPVVIELKPQAKYHALEELTSLTREILERPESQQDCVVIMGTLDPGLRYVHDHLPGVPVAHCEGGKNTPEAPKSRMEAEYRLYRIALLTAGCAAGYNCEETRINRLFNEYAGLRMLTVFPWSYGYSTWEENGARHEETYLSGYTMWTTDHGQYFFGCPLSVEAIPPTSVHFRPKGILTFRDGSTCEGDCELLVLSGDVSRSEDGFCTVTGEARVMYGRRIDLSLGSSYTIYSEPITISET